MSISTAQKAKADKFLDKLIRYTRADGSVAITDRRLWIQHMVLFMGGIPDTREVPRIKPMSRLAFFRADNMQQLAHERHMREAGTKTAYVMLCDGGITSELTKTDYDYANWFISIGG